MRRIWSENSTHSYSITTAPVCISRWMGPRPLRSVASTYHHPEISITIPGFHTATDFFRHRLRRELVIRLGQVNVSYKLYKKGGEWKVYDVAIEGISMALNYRSVLAEQIKREGIESVIDNLANAPDTLAINRQ